MQLTISFIMWFFNMIINNSSLFMLIPNLISININIMDMKRHILICVFISMLKANEKGEIVIRRKDSLLRKEWNSLKKLT